MTQVKDAEHISQDVYRALTRVFLQLDDCDRHLFTDYGLSPRQFWALQYLDEDQGRSMVDLSRALLTNKSNITAIVDHLEQASLARRTPDAHDRRVILITLTPEGRRLRDFVCEQHEERMRELLSTVGDGHLHILLDLLTKISGSLENYLEQAHNPALSLPG